MIKYQSHEWSVYAILDSAAIPGFDIDYLNKRVVLETRDSSRFQSWPKNCSYEEWESFVHQKLFCYELILPPSFPLPEAYRMMVSDLDRFFRLHSGIEKRTINCLTLVETTGIDKFATKGYINDAKISEDKLNIVIRNQSIKSLVEILNIYMAIPWF